MRLFFADGVMIKKEIIIIGGGLAGCEAALQLAESGWTIQLYEMRPNKMTPAHQTGDLAELVCSNSLKSMLPDTASGLLKDELQLLGCRLLPLAKKAAVKAGNALAVDRSLFSSYVTQALQSYPSIHIHREEVTSLPLGKTIIASGPLTSDALIGSLLETIGQNNLYFFDAIAPIVTAESLDTDIVFAKSRYDKGEADYLNCAFTKEEYYNFVDALRNGIKHEAHEFENEFFTNPSFHFYENCTPIEELARRGVDTLRFGVMRPVGLEDPRTGKRAFAVIQLRAENENRTAFNLVGCQTMLTYGEQKRILRLIPGMQHAEFERFGSIHRNTYLRGPAILNHDYSLKTAPHIHVAGQLAGVEGYVESIAGGLLTARAVNGNPDLPPETTILGQLGRHMLKQEENYQPMNANFGLMPPLTDPLRGKKERKSAFAERSLLSLSDWLISQ